MTQKHTGKSVSRRQIIAPLAIGAVVSAAGGRVLAQNATTGPRLVTPQQTEGPFYPRTFPDDVDNDLANIEGRSVAAAGGRLELAGSLRDIEGQVIDNAIIEIWHCDEEGVYHHVGGANAGDENFQGFGATLTDAQGRFHFTTILPGLYTGRTRHIHFKVKATGFRTLTSQLYFEQDHARNMRDGLYRRLSDAERALVTTDLNQSAAGTNSASLPIIIA